MNRSGGSPSATAYYLLCTNCQKVLRKKKRIRISQPLTRGPSAFIPEKEVVQANTVDEHTNFLMEECYTSGHLDNITQVMSLHTQYLESFLWSHFYILHMDGPLPLPYHIQKLVKTGENNWSLPELVHAVVLLAHYHALASFVFGSGINPEKDSEISNGFRIISVNNFCICYLANDNNIENASLTGNNFGIVDSLSELEASMKRMKRLQEEREDEEASQEEMTTHFDKKKESLFVVSGDTFHSLPHSDFEDNMIITSDVSQYIEDPGFGHEDFARRREEHLPTFRAQEYTWKNHGFSLVNRLCSDIGHLLDEKFQMVYNFTYNTMAIHEDVDTTMLHRALSNHVHCLFGITYYGYDYREINQLLE
ncbi:Sestrin-3 [Heterocephalus glaber]|uniref:Sestrin-3 n=1 Tax=Heterocephalus glaber TaxID=10181 RepID=G5ANK0_HETGA|nr:Sestrin-3 [Heterocephalus glaber]